MSFFCRAFGLLLRTELPIPGALPEEAALDGAAELSVLYGSAAVTGERGSSGPYRAGAEGLGFEKAGVAKFLCAWDGRSIRVDAEDGVPPEEVGEYLIATALPAMLWLRGEMMLHAGAAVPPGGGGAVALAGASGAGKSTVLQALMAAGAGIVAEDSLCVRARDGGFEVSGLPGCVHVRDRGEGLDGDRAALKVPPARRLSGAPLVAVVVLEPLNETGLAASWERLPVPEAMAALLRHRHRPRVPEFAGLSAGLLPRWRDIARGVPVYSWKFSGPVLSTAGDGGLLSALAALGQDVEERL